VKENHVPAETRERPRRHFTWNAFSKQYSSAVSIFVLAELHGHPRNQRYHNTEKWMILRTRICKIYSAENAILLLYLQFQLAYLIYIVMRNNKRFIRQTYSIYIYY